MHARFAVAMKEGGAKAALKLVDEELKQAQSPQLRKRLRLTRLFYLEWADLNEEALAYATKLAKDESYSSEENRRIRTRVAFNLKQLGRIDEMVAVYDKLIAEVIEDHATTWGYLRDKAAFPTGANRPTQALEAWESSRRFVEIGTDNWLDTEVFRARLLGQLGRHTEAIAVLDSALNVKSLTKLNRANLLAEKAMVLGKAGRREEALACAKQTEELLNRSRRAVTTNPSRSSSATSYRSHVTKWRTRIRRRPLASGDVPSARRSSASAHFSEEKMLTDTDSLSLRQWMPRTVKSSA